MNRKDIITALYELTYLSDAAYKKTDKIRKYFYGTLGSEDFELQSIADENRLIPFLEGRMKGAENEMYVFLNLKSFRMRRIYFVFSAFIIFCSGYALQDFFRFGTAVFQSPPFLLFLTISLCLIVFVIIRCRNFWKVQKNTLDFFRGLLAAETVKYSEIPGVFKL